MKTRFNCDQLNGQDVFGWGVVEQAGTGPRMREDDFVVTLRAGGTVIGQQRRMVPRPDADKAAGQPGVIKGFRMPVLAPAAVLVAVAGDEPLPLTLSFAGAEVALWKQPDRLLDLGEFRSLKLADPDGPVTIADAWFASDRELRLRIEKLRGAHGHSPPYKIRFFQPEFSPGLRIAQIGETTVSQEDIAFVTQFLRNPLLPVLITVCGGNGDVVVMDSIPFPSLCRGGLHHAELLSLQSGSGYLHDLRTFNDTLLREIWDAPKDGSAHVSRIAIDTRGATGAERIFSAEVLQWLTLVQGIDVRTVGAGKDQQDADADLLGQALMNAGLAGHSGKATRKGGYTLSLPADAIPGLAAILSRRLAADRQGPSAFVTAHAVTGNPQWFVSLPPIGADLADLQPVDQPAICPELTPAGRSKTKQAAGLASGGTMAVRFIEEAFRTDEQRLMPIALDIDALVAGASAVDADPLVSVIVSVRNGAPMVQEFLASLAGQTLASKAELVIVNNRSFSKHRAQIEESAKAHFDGRYSIIDADHAFNLSAQTNAGVAASKAPFLVMAHPDVISYDPRTLATLVTMAAAERVAVAGCTLLQPKSANSEGIRFHSAGIFPSSLVFGGPARIEFSEPDCGLVFGPATYPVAAVNFALACVRRTVWEELGGFDQSQFATDFGDVDFCLRALAAGYTNACTTAAAAFHHGRATRGLSFDVLAPGRLPVLSLPDLLSKCTVIRRLV